ncbi:hypothetical protein C8R44DRAFT_749891 [Mycena epipterygia]|nr:hypothetical protein C8R44DRAFT_749891 [Mycena epipterygia]
MTAEARARTTAGNVEGEAGKRGWGTAGECDGEAGGRVKQGVKQGGLDLERCPNRRKESRWMVEGGGIWRHWEKGKDGRNRKKETHREARSLDLPVPFRGISSARELPALPFRASTCSQHWYRARGRARIERRSRQCSGEGRVHTRRRGCGALGEELKTMDYYDRTDGTGKDGEGRANTMDGCEEGDRQPEDSGSGGVNGHERNVLVVESISGPSLTPTSARRLQGPPRARAESPSPARRVVVLAFFVDPDLCHQICTLLVLSSAWRRNGSCRRAGRVLRGASGGEESVK